MLGVTWGSVWHHSLTASIGSQSCGSEARVGSSGFSTESHSLKSQYPPDWLLSGGSEEGSTCTHSSGWQDLVPWECGTEVPVSLMAVGRGCCQVLNANSLALMGHLHAQADNSGSNSPHASTFSAFLFHQQLEKALALRFV